jgi:hypothetical protein
VKTPFGTIALPQLPAAVNQILAPLGIGITMPDAGDLSKDAQGAMFSHGLQITIDTAVLKKVSPFTPVLRQLVAQIPASLTAQLPPTVGQVLGALPELAPRIVMTIGSATSQAVASPAVDVSGGASGGAGGSLSGGGTSDGSSAGLNGSGGSSGGTVSGGSSGSASGGYADSGGVGGGAATSGGSGGVNGGVSGSQSPVDVNARPAAAADAMQPAAFGGLPGQLIVGALAIACAVAWGLRKYSSLLFGGPGCDQGHSAGVPDLREFDEEEGSA